MSQLPERVQKRLKDLSQVFTRGLPERVSLIQELCERTFRVGFDTDACKELRLNVHKLSGSGATFGYQVVSNVARELDSGLGELLEKGNGSMREAREWVGEAVARLGAAVKEIRIPRLLELPVVEDYSGTLEAARQIVCLYENDDLLNSDIKEQIGFFGLSVEVVGRSDEIMNLIDAGNHVILVMNVNHLGKSEATQASIKSLRSEYEKPRLHIIYLSDRDDFATRLLAVRNGGDAFFTEPVDIGHLIDKIYACSAPQDHKPYHILIVDDDLDQVSYHAMVLQQAGMITSVVSDPQNVIKLLVESRPELILMDMYMPTCTGVELAALIRQQEAFVGIPIVFLSVERDLEKQLEAIRTGGDDFLTKPIAPEHLIASIRFKAERTRSIRYYMERDSLTGLLNHTNLKQHLVNDLERARRIGGALGFAMIDIDHFKNVNDSYGHLTGDRVIKSLTRLLQERLRKTDVIGRYGGEEFGIILFNTGPEAAERIMNELRESFSRVRQYEGRHEFYCTFSCGIASFPPISDAAKLGEDADRAMYVAKKQGRNRVVLAG